MNRSEYGRIKDMLEVQCVGLTITEFAPAPTSLWG
jgi:hypothetical protein